MERYKMKYKYFMGVVQITFKVWSDGKIDIKLDDNFALSIGYGSAYAMKKGCKAFQMAINTDWARVDETGKIFLFSDKGLIPLGCCSIYGFKPDSIDCHIVKLKKNGDGEFIKQDATD